MAEKYCCVDCFGHAGVKRFIIELKFWCGRQGDCDYCGAKGVELLEPSKLADQFELLTSCYVEDLEKGKSLAYRLKEDWHLFDSEGMEDDRIHELLADILGDSDAVSKTVSFNSKLIEEKSFELRWGDFSEEIIRKNRWFLRNDLSFNELKRMLLWIVVDNKRTLVAERLFRARLDSESESLNVLCQAAGI